MKKGIKTYSSMKELKIKKSLQANKKQRIRRVFLCSFLKKKFRGSLTVEAALLLPLALCALTAWMSILDLYRIQAEVKTSLHQSAKELGMYASICEVEESSLSPVGWITTGACITYAKHQLPDLGENVTVNLAGSCYQNHQIQLYAHITYKLPFPIFSFSKLTVKNSSKVAAWVGYWPQDWENQEGGEEEMVYVSNYESVYHTSACCSHLDLSVHKDEKEKVKDKRNAYGKKYQQCEKCKGESTQVYYTEKGEHYHTQAACSGLKRTVRLIEKSQVLTLQQCERCREKEGRAYGSYNNRISVSQ